VPVQPLQELRLIDRAPVARGMQLAAAQRPQGVQARVNDFEGAQARALADALREGQGIDTRGNLLAGLAKALTIGQMARANRSREMGEEQDRTDRANERMRMQNAQRDAARAGTTEEYIRTIGQGDPETAARMRGEVLGEGRAMDNQIALEGRLGPVQTQNAVAREQALGPVQAQNEAARARLVGPIETELLRQRQSALLPGRLEEVERVAGIEARFRAPPAPRDRFRVLNAEEMQARNLNPSSTYQVNETTGQITTLGGGTSTTLGGPEQRARAQASLQQVIEGVRLMERMERDGYDLSQDFIARQLDGETGQMTAASRFVGGEDYITYNGAYAAIESGLPAIGGAAITPEERQVIAGAMLPTPQDSPAERRLKQRRRQQYANGIARMAGQPEPFPDVGAMDEDGLMSLVYPDREPLKDTEVNLLDIGR
jgi:hypothetical protein